ncbi:MAG: endonuclease/exonuclease/phosphatase family protein [Lentimonas sp.]
MKPIILQLLLIGVCAVSLNAESLRIATYNVRNYLVMDRQVAGSWRPSYPKPEIEKASVREIINAAQPDILVLQEMGSVDFLEELRADLHQEGLHYPYAVHLSGPDSIRHVAVLSMLPPLEVKKHKYLDFRYLERRERVKRGLLEVSFEGAKGARFTLFALHLKSRWTEDEKDLESELRRTREAEACRNLVVKRTIDRNLGNYMIIGDFNAPPSSAAQRRFHRRGQLEIGSSLPAYDSRGEVWTYFYKKESSYQTVDGFVMSPAMLKYVKDGAGVVVDSKGALVGTDHRLVYADLEFADSSSNAATK